MAKRGRPRLSRPKVSNTGHLDFELGSVEEAMRRLASLRPEAMRQTNRLMMSKCTNILISETRKLIRGSMKNAGRIPEKWRYIIRQPLVKAISKSVGYLGTWARVSIYNPNTFLVHMHNKGTKQRRIEGYPSRSHAKTKRRYKQPGANRGVLPAQNYIERATKICNPEVARIQEQGFLEGVNRQWHKSYSKHYRW
jgi:hypothetical protein